MTIRISVPGKIVIAGEWAVLEPGNRAIATSIDKKVHAELNPYSGIKLEIPDYNLEFEAELKNNQLVFAKELDPETKKQISFIKSAIETVSEFTTVKNDFYLKTDSQEMYYQSKKIGFGSSAAITIACIIALLKHLNFNSENFKDLVFKLAAISHYRAQGSLGSGLDIAASVFGGAIAYSRFDPTWLGKELKQKSIQEIVEIQWLSFSVEHLPELDNLELLVGFTGKSASTSELIQKVNLFQSENPKAIADIYTQIASNTENLISAWKEQSSEQILKLINQNHSLLKDLSATSKTELITPELEKLVEIAQTNHSAGKLSGAGGGDCGIALSKTKYSDKIKKEWKMNDIDAIKTAILK